jgi:aryl-alcohol dehydrogenase-like predicted oxidoreductase
LRRTLAPLARRALAAAGPLAAPLRRAAPRANLKLPITPALIEAELAASLRRLGTSYVDLFALHAPDPAEAGRDDVLRALEAVLAAGKARAVAVAGGPEAAAAALAAGAPYGVLQLPLPPPGAGAGVLAAARGAGLGVVLHSVIGAAAGEAPARALARAFALNPDGVVLASMFSGANLAANLAAAARPPGAPAG